jgi:hypothetical protein
MCLKKYIEFYVLILVLLLFLSEAKAQGPPIFTETPIMLGLDGGGVRTFGKFISKENAKVYIQPIAIPYNISTKWQVGGIIPLMNNAPEGAESRFGLTDVKIYAKYQIHKKDGKGKTFRTLVKLTESFPTGNTSDAPPLGSGAWETTVALVSGLISTKYGLYGELAYNITSDGLPDKLIYNVAFAYPLLPQKYPPNQINVFLEFNGNLITGSGIHNLFISPGIQYIAGSRFLIETGIQLPLTQGVADSEKTKFMFTLGVRVLIF